MKMPASRPKGRPFKQVLDEDAAARNLEKLRRIAIDQARLDEEKIAVIMDSHALGLTNARIAEALGMNSSTVSNWIRAFGAE